MLRAGSGGAEAEQVHYQYSNYQVEYSRNLIFEIGEHMDQIFQALIDRSRVLLDLKTVKTILGYKHRPKYRRRKKSAEWEVAVEKPTYDPINGDRPRVLNREMVTIVQMI